MSLILNSSALPAANKKLIFLEATFLGSVAFFIALTGFAENSKVAVSKSSSSENAPSLQRTIHEAENLSLNHDRALACGVLWRNMKKAGKDDAKVLKEKLMQLSRYYYTDKGFQAFLVGKEFFQKQKFQDAADKLLEADDLEAGNVEVLHYLTLAQLWLKKIDQAEATNKRALQNCPADLELSRDLLAVLVAQENWTDALSMAQTLTRDSGDNSAQTLQTLGIAAYKTDALADGKKALEQSLAADSHFPETYYWLATIKNDKDSVKLLTKYVELCKNRVTPGATAPPVLAVGTEREIGICSHFTEVEKKIVP